MHKPALFFLGGIFIIVSGLTAAMIYLGSASRDYVASRPAQEAGSIADQAKMEQVYREKTKIIVGRFWELATAGRTSDQAAVSGAKNDLLALKVPSKFKELHLKLVLAADKLLVWLSSGEEAGKKESLAIIRKAKSDYDWLN